MRGAVKLTGLVRQGIRRAQFEGALHLFIDVALTFVVVVVIVGSVVVIVVQKSGGPPGGGVRCTSDFSLQTVRVPQTFHTFHHILLNN